MAEAPFSLSDYQLLKPALRSFFRNLFSASPYPSPDRQAVQDSFGGGESAFAPFLLEHRSHDVQLNGSFKPEARISISPNFGASGLLRSVGSDELATLLLVLSGVTPGGGFVATPETLAPMLGVSRSQMRRCLKRLASLQWHGKPLVTAMTAESGLRLFAPSPHLFETQSNAIIPIAHGKQARDVMPSDAPPLPPSRHEESVARSRELYARPRAEVEGEIKRFLNGEVPHFDANLASEEDSILNQTAAESASAVEKTEAGQSSEGRQWLALKKRLFTVGLSHAQAQTLLDGYPFERIERQLEWLPYRDARSPVAYLLAAVASDYAPPRSLPPVVAANAGTADDSNSHD